MTSCDTPRASDRKWRRRRRRRRRRRWRRPPFLGRNHFQFDMSLLFPVKLWPLDILLWFHCFTQFHCLTSTCVFLFYSLLLPVQTRNCDTMKVAVVFVLLFATVLCRPAKKVTISSSESSEEVRRPAIRNKEALVPQTAPVQAAAAASASDESADLSAEVEEAAEAPAPDYKSSGPDTTSAPETETASVSDDSHDDDDDDDTDTEEEEESSDSDESGESSTLAAVTVSPVIVTEEPAVGTTEEPIVPTIVAGPETARGDSLGRYPSDYKSIVYGGEDKSYHKVPAPYKSYEYVDAGKKAAYDMTHGNEVEKSLKVYKALQVHSDLLEEDTSTPDVESQGLDAAQDQDISVRQASIPGEPEEEESASASEASAGQSDSTSAPQEEDDESASAASDSASASLESEDEESQSSEEATATPGAADSDSDESDSVEGDSDEEGAVPVATTDVPMVITAK
ncbi:osteopontin isoform X2 [Scophthalmus maximus]|uniref:osteopontin isoform X2 n=1 Tax=Scophthalmus maximus TaxID=52904 RepID=UPI001FA8C30F|nr:osteopontin isoform X2 [Scophthalmus maximus]